MTCPSGHHVLRFHDTDHDLEAWPVSDGLPPDAPITEATARIHCVDFRCAVCGHVEKGDWEDCDGYSCEAANYERCRSCGCDEIENRMSAADLCEECARETVSPSLPTTGTEREPSPKISDSE